MGINTCLSIKIKLLIKNSIYKESKVEEPNSQIMGDILTLVSRMGLRVRATLPLPGRKSLPRHDGAKAERSKGTFP